MVVTFDEAKAAATLRRAFADIEGHPVNASFTLEGGVPVIRAEQAGTVCCSGRLGAKILAALQGGSRAVTLELTEGPASFTTADAEEYGIKEQWAANFAWRSGAPTTAGPGFTTYHDPTGARITNIHRMADLVRGAVIAPGESFSINDHVGERTLEKGFVPAGAIRDGLARGRGRRRRVAVRHHHVQRCLLRRAPDRLVTSALRVLRPLSPRARGHHGVPGP